MNKNILALFSLIVITLFLVGCSSTLKDNGAITSTSVQDNNKNSVDGQTATGSDTNPASNAIKEINIEATNFDFIQTGPQINKGDKVRITFTVTEGTHSLVLSGYNIEFTPMGPGKTESQTFVADKSGTFDYRCNNYCGAGHMDMIGKLVVN
jgi:cytochrome c oxidase subunit 2